MLLQSLLFLHLLAVGALFAGIVAEVMGLVRLHRAATLAEVRAAVVNVPAIGPMMGLASLLLIAMGIAMIYLGGFGWSPGWISIAFLLVVVLSVTGPLVIGRRSEAIHAMAYEGGDGPITPAIEIARADRMLNYFVFLGLFELVAALFIMVVRPELLACIVVALAAAVLAGIPAMLLVRAQSLAQARRQPT